MILTVKYPITPGVQGFDAMFAMEERLRANLGKNEDALDSGYGANGMRDLAIRTDRMEITKRKLLHFFNRENIHGVEFGIREEEK